jgi:hypothetical protein
MRKQFFACQTVNGIFGVLTPSCQLERPSSCRPQSLSPIVNCWRCFGPMFSRFKKIGPASCTEIMSRWQEG